MKEEKERGGEIKMGLFFSKKKKTKRQRERRRGVVVE
jgi:hypothetical protein